MATKVFISWGGDLSRQIAEVIREWLPGALQYVKPYFTPEDIEKGSLWDSEIAQQLSETDVGILIITKDNAERPWILFESGALSKSIERARVCPILFNLEPADVKGPLTRFQATRFNKNDFKSLFETINRASGDDRLDQKVLEEVFEMWWPRLEGKVTKILKSEGDAGLNTPRSDRDILEEILSLSRISVRNSPANLSRAQVRENLSIAITGLEKLLQFAVSRDEEKALDGTRDIVAAIHRLCTQSGNHDILDRFTIRNSSLSDLDPDSDSDNAREPRNWFEWAASRRSVQ